MVEDALMCFGVDKHLGRRVNELRHLGLRDRPFDGRDGCLGCHDCFTRVTHMDPERQTNKPIRTQSTTRASDEVAAVVTRRGAT
jgi:hypothetical protein